MEEYVARAVKVMERIHELASISEDTKCITRTFGTDAFLAGSYKVRSWMEAAGLETRIDNIGNVRGKLASKHPVAKTFVIGSHIDTVINAGKFDGSLGVLIGLDVVEQIFFYRDTLPFHIELIALSDEEGVRFHTTFLGSKVVAGSFDKSLLQKKDASGTTLNAVIQKMGGDPERLHQDAIQPQDWLAYFEMHIEQGPVLYEQNIPVAAVTAIAGQKRIEIRFQGMAGHAGTVPMDMRRDALCCASEFVLEVEKFGLANKEKIVATVGKLQVAHAASNVIPGEVACTLDVRSADKATLDASYKSLQKMCASICNKRGIHFEWNLVQETEPVTCDQQMNKWLCQAIETAGYEVVKLVSGAGHDAVPVSKVAPVALLFVRCFEGISHNPLEDVELNDIAVAIEVADQFIHYLIHHNQ